MESSKKVKHECSSCKQTFNRAERLSIHIKKGCYLTTCSTCNEKFRDVRKLQIHWRTHIPVVFKTRCTMCNKNVRNLQKHRKNADPRVCNQCDTIFCHVSEYERHNRTEHIGWGITTKIDNSKFDQPIYPRTGYENNEGYLEEMEKHHNKICDSRSEGKFHVLINKKLTSDFTYNDLQKLLDDIYVSQRTAFKVNLGFGFMLYHTISKEFKYFYVSSNNLLFARAFTISSKKDITSLMERIIDLNLAETFIRMGPCWTNKCRNKSFLFKECTFRVKCNYNIIENVILCLNKGINLPLFQCWKQYNNIFVIS